MKDVTELWHTVPVEGYNRHGIITHISGGTVESYRFCSILFQVTNAQTCSFLEIRNRWTRDDECVKLSSIEATQFHESLESWDSRMFLGVKHSCIPFLIKNTKTTKLSWKTYDPADILQD